MSIVLYTNDEKNILTTAHATYSNYGNASEVDFDKTGYVHVANAALVEYISSSLYGKVEQDNGELSLLSEEKLHTTSGIKNVYTEEASLIFDNTHRGDSFYVYGTVNTNGSKKTISYDGGSFKIVANSNTSVLEMTDYEAREFVSDFINYIQFNPHEIQNIEKCLDGSYKLTCTVENTQRYEEFASKSALGVYTGYTLYFKVRMNGSEIEFIGSYLTIKGVIAQHTVSTELTFTSEQN